MQRPSRNVLAHTQNFLRSGALVDRLLDASSIHAGDLVLDLGAGLGAITRRLASRGCEVFAIEKDADLWERLQQTMVDVPNVRVLHADLVELRLPQRAYKVFSNIPFDVTADVVRRLTRGTCPPEDAYLVVQREAADRFIGQPRTTLPAVLLFPWFEASLFYRFRRTDFAPAPRVEVVMLRLRKRGPPLVAPTEAQLYRDFAVALFTSHAACITDALQTVLGHQRALRLARALQIGPETSTDLPPRRWLELFQAAAHVAGEELRWRVTHAEGRLREQQRKLRKLHRTRVRRLDRAIEHAPPQSRIPSSERSRTLPGLCVATA
ncbi:MAG: rRNA adenine N(6)-methyltransferase family protein [Chloroflexi bacterium]|nr:rRNA adenine N(6)-methyltransferase family protein [Chloroflexota bacterium]